MANQIQINKLEEKRLRVRTSITKEELRAITEVRRAD
jgi:hypothetical protein